MNEKVQELRELQHMAAELAEQIESLQDAIKAEMTAQAVDTLTGTDWSVSWKRVKIRRFDLQALRAAMPQLADMFMKETETRRFVLA